jgi:methyl-accepting chemotaxis protein
MSINKSVRVKLLGVVLILSGVSAGIGLIGWNRMGQINDRLAHIVDHTAEAQTLAARVRIYLTSIHRNEKNIVLSDTPEEFVEHSRSLEEQERYMFGLLSQLEKVASPKEREHIEIFRRDYAAFKSVSARVQDLARRDTDGHAARLSATRSEETYRLAAAVMDEIAEAQETTSNRLIEQLKQNSNESDRQLIERVANASLAVIRTERIVQDLIRMLRAEKNFVLANDDAAMEQHAQDLQRRLADVRSRSANLMPLLDEEGKQKMALFEARLNDWLAINSQIQQLGRESTRALAANISSDEGRRAFENAEEEMVNVMKLADQAMESEKANAETAYASAVMMMLISAVLGIIAGAVFALLVINKIVKTLLAVVERMRRVAAGDLTGDPIPVTTRDEIGQLAQATNEMQSSLREIVTSISANSEQVSAAATEVSATSEQMAASSEHQRAQLTQVAAAIEEMAATVTEVSGRTGEVSRQSTEAGDQANEGGQIVRRTVEEMGQIASQVESTSAAVGQLSEKAVKIGEILTVINDIADQTNLLALNAAIEAARAGEHGRGFAVVADEVRKLAERTQEATQEVSRSITEIQTSTGEATEMMGASKDRVTQGVQLARQAGDSLESIVRGSTTVAQSIDSIAAAVEEQSATSAEIARSIEVISAAADEATQGANQAAAAATQRPPRS